MAIVSQMLSAGVLGASVLWCAWCLSVAGLRSSRGSVRVAGTVVVAIWLLVASFQILSALHQFAPGPAVALWVVAAVGVHVATHRLARPWPQLVADAASAVSVVTQAGRLRWLVALTTLVLALHVVRGILSPPLAWDDLTYHLFRSASWVQAGRWAIEPAPNAWGYAAYFPPTGDVLWAWAMLPTHDDSLLVFANLFIVTGIAAGIYACVRWFGGAASIALLAACVITIAPPAVAYLPSGYVEPTTLALFVCGVLFAGRAIAGRAAADLVLASAALGLAVGVKISNLAFVVPGLALIGYLCSSCEGARRRAVLAGACLMAASVGVPFFIRTWIDTGSPTYPVPLEVGGTTIFAGNFWQQQIFSGPVEGVGPDSWQHLLHALFLPAAADFVDRGQFLNPGPGAVLLALGVLSGVRGPWWRRSQYRAIGLYIVGAAVLVAVSMLQPSVVNLRVVLGSSLGRFLLVPLAALVLSVATADSRRRPERWLSVALVANAVFAVPLGWSGPDGPALRAFFVRALPLLIGGAVVAVVLWRSQRIAAALVVSVLAATAAVAAWLPARAALRHDYWRAASDGLVYSPSRDVALLAQDWPLWKWVDQPAPLTIAVAAGWPRMSPTGARYPFMGSRLQNRVVYVPITGDGDVCPDPDCYGSLDDGDFGRWLDRIVSGDVGAVVVLSPSIEGAWADAHSDIFVRQTVPDAGSGAIYLVDRAAAAGALSRP